MPSYDQIDDEEALHKMMNETDDFDERKKIRARLREIREKQREEMEQRRKEREANSADAVKLKLQFQEEQKKLKLEGFDKQAGKTTTTTESKTGPSGEKINTTTTTHQSSQSLPGGGSRTVITKKTETTSKSTGLGSLGKPAGQSTNAMAAFKQMDNSDSSAASKTKMMRSPSNIKQILLDWAKAMTQGYPNVEVTNFSSSWNTGMAFCALIHHFFPDAFDFSKLSPKARRFNFNLAFDTAEKRADIAPLLDVDDMVKMKNPDWKCVFTYVQSIYRHLRDHENNKVMPCPVATAEQ